MLRVVLFHHEAHTKDAWRELVLLPSRATLLEEWQMGRCAVAFSEGLHRSKTEKGIPDSADKWKNDWAGKRGESKKMRFVVRRKAGKATFEALRLSRCYMLHRRSAEHQTFPRLNSFHRRYQGVIDWAASSIPVDSMGQCEIRLWLLGEGCRAVTFACAKSGCEALQRMLSRSTNAFASSNRVTRAAGLKPPRSEAKICAKRVFSIVTPTHRRADC